MNPVSLTLIALRSAALAALLAGQRRTSDALYATADAVEAGRTTDVFMGEVGRQAQGPRDHRRRLGRL